MTMAVFGSKPELGSSQNKYFGLLTIARAIATRFCIPPEISEGFLRLALTSWTRFNTKFTLSAISVSDL